MKTKNSAPLIRFEGCWESGYQQNFTKDLADKFALKGAWIITLGKKVVRIPACPQSELTAKLLNEGVADDSTVIMFRDLCWSKIPDPQA